MNQPVQFTSSLLKTLDVSLLSLSFLTFPISRFVALSAIALFFLKRILSFSTINRQNLITAIALYTSLLLLAFQFYRSGGWEVFTNNHLYPVTSHDYLVVIVTFFAIKLNPLTVDQLQKILDVFSLTPLIVFLIHWQNFSFDIRTDMGFENPNLLGLYLAVSIPVILFSLLQNRSHLPQSIGLGLKIIRLTTLLLAFLMLLASGSKSSLLVTLFNFVLISFYFIKPIVIPNKNHQDDSGSILLPSSDRDSRTTENNWNNYSIKLHLKPRKIVLFSFFLFLTLITIYLLTQQSLTVLERFFTIWDESSQLRVQIYRCFYNLGMEKFWFGWFPENTAKLCENQLGWLTGEVNHAHNFILQLFVDYGIIAVLVILYILVIGFLLPLYNSLKDNRNYNPKISYLVYGLFFSNLAVVLISLLQSAFYHDPFFPLWLGLFWGSQNALLLGDYMNY